MKNVTLVMPFIIFFVFIFQSYAEPYKIGVILPLSGEAASFGESAKKGINLAYDSLAIENQEKIKIIFEDDALSPSKSVSAFNKLNTQNKIDAVVLFSSGVSNAVAPLAEKNKKLMLAIASDKKFLKNKKFVFNHWVTPEKESSVLIDEMQRRGYKRFAMLVSEHDGAIAVEKSFKDEIKKRKLTDNFVFSERVLMRERDFKSLIAKIRRKNIDGLGLCLLPGSLSSFAKQARAGGLSSDIFGYEIFEDEAEVKASGGALYGSWYVNADESNKDFRELHERVFNKVPGYASANMYDIINLLFSGLQKYGHDNEKIATYLENLKDYKGAAGTYSASGDHRFTLPAVVKVVTKDGFEVVHTEVQK